MKEFLAAMLLSVAPVYADPESAQWGGDTGSRYELWDLLTETGLGSEETWSSLKAGERNALLKKATEECRKAEDCVNTALRGADPGAILQIQRKSLTAAAVCRPEKSADAEAAEKRRATLARIEIAAKAGKLPQADIEWLQANGISLNNEESKTAALDAQTRTEESKANFRKAAKKHEQVSALAKKGDAGLNTMFDKAAVSHGQSQAHTAIAIGKGMSAISPGPRGSTASSIPHDAPPEPGSRTAAKKYDSVKHQFKSPFPEEDVKALDRAVQAKKDERLKANYTLGSLGNIRQMIKLAPATVDRGDGPGSGCRDWGEAVAKAINTDPSLKGKYEAGVICGAKVPYLSQHCVTVFHRKGADINDPKTDVWYYDAWRKKTESGPVDQQLCRFPVPLEQDFYEGPLGQKTTSNHHISYYDLNKTGPEGVARKISGAQTNVLFKRGCFN
jgi:hypothetical protein